MATGASARTLSVMVKFKMSKETAELVKSRFAEMGFTGESVSYLDCVLFDAALETLGIEKEYYGIDDDEWKRMQELRAAEESRFNTVTTIDVDKEFKSALC